MGLFDSFLDTASSAFNWLNNNKAALDLISGAAKGYGAYMQYKQANKQQKFMQQQFDEDRRRWEETHSSPDAYDNSKPLASFEASKMLSGNMANAMKPGGM